MTTSRGVSGLVLLLGVRLVGGPLAVRILLGAVRPASGPPTGGKLQFFWFNALFQTQFSLPNILAVSTATLLSRMRPARLSPCFLLFAMAWLVPAHAGKWVWVSEGDCPGPQVIGSAGVNPDDELCTAAIAGKTALCFTQVCYPGCQYIDVATRQCQGGAELAEVYTCVVEIPSPDGNALGHAVPGR
jgi:hypothetical protein